MQRTRSEIEEDRILKWPDNINCDPSYQKTHEEVILEVLLDIRDLLSKENN